MKRILHIIAQTPGKTGSGIFLKEILKEADKKGYKQGVIAGVPKNYSDIEFESSHLVKFYPVVFETDELPFPVVGMSDVMPYKSTRYKDLTEKMFINWKNSFARTIVKAINDLKPELIITHHLWILTALVNEIVYNVPVISICHGTDIRQLSIASKYSDYVIEGCKKTELVLALNKYQKQIIVEKYGVDVNKVIVVGGGYNSDIFYPPIKRDVDGVIRLIYAGKLSFSKGVLSLIKAYNKVEQNKEEIELILAGSGSGEEERIIKRAAAESKMQITFLGSLEQRNLAETFRNSDIFILPSFYEGLSLVLIEALACGLFAVSTELPGLKSWLGEKVSNSGIVKFVKLPRLIDVDVPYDKDIPEFEARLQEAIEKQIDNLKNRELCDNNDLNTRLREMSWSGIFNKIESCF